MNAPDVINILLLGGLLGITGQGIRIIVGLKKLNDSKNSAAIAGQPTDDFSAQRLLVSIFIGFVAGILGMLIKYFTAANQTVILNSQLIIAIIAGGYSGVDFIEGVFNTYLPKTTSTANQQKQPDEVPAAE